MYHNSVGGGNPVNVVARRLFDAYFVGYGLSWVVIHLFRRWDYPLPFLNGWLTDFCFVPFICHVALTFTRFIFIHDEAYCYPFSFVLFVAVYVTVLFEVIVPGYSEYGTGDAYDGIAYFAGALFFYFVHQKKIPFSLPLF
ncbi:hypothetical protein [Spirosoma sp.]|uniref:hypothetical protein n=1 Tax=Spirosoma sp. TaxID=1899569 RepID=UPI00263300FF|nr:hypothetical protein [Spirosoma sp.]MCX6215947.1 hypothetical protein [Spirosoma sp.]